jgi:hypothetical protein
MQALRKLIEQGEIDPSFVISSGYRLMLSPRLYKTFPDKQDHCTKVSRDPWAKETTGKAAQRPLTETDAGYRHQRRHLI